MLTLLLALTLQAAPLAKEDSAVIAAQDARVAAMLAGNADYLETALDPSLTYHHSTGAAQSKAEFVRAVREGALKYKGLDVVERHVRRFGSAAIVTGIIHIQAVNNGEVIDSRARFTDVYEMKTGKFVQMAWQSTRIP